jgi:hypothetical protein
MTSVVKVSSEAETLVEQPPVPGPLHHDGAEFVTQGIEVVAGIAGVYHLCPR